MKTVQIQITRDNNSGDYLVSSENDVYMVSKEGKLDKYYSPLSVKQGSTRFTEEVSSIEVPEIIASDIDKIRNFIRTKHPDIYAKLEPAKLSSEAQFTY